MHERAEKKGTESTAQWPLFLPELTDPSMTPPVITLVLPPS